MKAIQQADTRLKREVDYRLSKWIITNIEQLLEPDEIEEIWRELLSIYLPPTASVENVCGTMSGNGLGKYVAPIRTMNPQEYTTHLFYPLSYLLTNADASNTP